MTPNLASDDVTTLAARVGAALRHDREQFFAAAITGHIEYLREREWDAAMSAALLRAPRVRVGGLWGSWVADPQYVAHAATCIAIAMGQRR